MSTASSLRLLALHGLRLKGIAGAHLLAETMDTDVDEMRAELDTLVDVDLAVYRYGRMEGFQLTPEGRAFGQRLLHDEVAATGTRPALEQAYADFRAVNDQLLGVCTAWQIREVAGERVPNDHRDADYDARVRADLGALHQQIEPVLGVLGDTLLRFQGHRRRLRNALAQVEEGDDDYFTTPMFPSYHTTWFELHEDLLATLGKERASERDTDPHDRSR